MCSWCGDGEDAKRERRSAARFAKELEALALDYEHASQGRLKTHSEEIAPTVARAGRVIRQLVEDWL